MVIIDKLPIVLFSHPVVDFLFFINIGKPTLYSLNPDVIISMPSNWRGSIGPHITSKFSLRSLGFGMGRLVWFLGTIMSFVSWIKMELSTLVGYEGFPIDFTTHS